MTVLAFQRRPARGICSGTVVRLGMAQLSPDGLSEQWLLRECGDRHWTLIAEAMGQDRAVFTSQDGRPLYAAFCATSLKLSKSEGSRLGDDLTISSELFRVSAGRLGSLHHFRLAGRELGRLGMISTFVSHDSSGSNRRILRSQPVRDVDISRAPEPLMQLSDYARDIARQLRNRTMEQPPLARLRPCPRLDFNAVGLLYFATFSRLAETAEWEAGSGDGPLAARDIVHLGNVDRGDVLAVHNSAGRLFVVRSDGAIIAHIATQRH